MNLPQEYHIDLRDLPSSDPFYAHELSNEKWLQLSMISMKTDQKAH